MKIQNVLTTEEEQIRGLVEDWARALRARNIDGLMANYTPDILLFDAIPPLQHKGVEAYTKLWEECFACMQGPIDFEIRDLGITAGEDVAFCHSLNRMGGTMSNGERTEMWLRATVCFQKIDGRWRVTHEHVSVPFDPTSLKASIDLQP
jgi:uncharacterized protein (TIGR02246 family)